MGTNIKGITIEIGGNTTGLQKALSGVNKEIKDTQSDLKSVERLLKLDPKNTELLAQKQKLLKDAVSQTKDKLTQLKDAEKQVQQQMKEGKVSQAQYDALKREIIETENSLKSLKTAASRVNSAMKEIGDTAGKVADKTKGLSTAAGGLLAAVGATVPATEELRADLSRLDLNAEENAVSINAAREAWKQFAVQSGETDSAIEATSNLLQAGFTESNLQKAVEGLSGAALRFPDTLKVESLADSLQETLATGSATGQFAELLDRLGIGAEKFTEQLANCKSEAEKQNLALQTLSSAGLDFTYKAWANNNEEMLANKEANIDVQQEMAKLAETVMPFLTKAVEFASSILNFFNNLSPEVQNAIFIIIALIAAISPIASVIQGISAAIGVMNAVSLASPVTWIVLGIVAAVAALIAIIVLCVKYWDEIQAAGAAAWEWIKNAWQSAGEWFKNKIITPISNFFSGLWDGLVYGAKMAWWGIQTGVLSMANFVISVINGMIKGALAPLNLAIKALNLIPGVNIPKVEFSIPKFKLPEMPQMAKGGILSAGTALVGEAGPELLTVNNGRAMVTPLTTNQKNAGLTFGGGVTVNIGHFVNNDTDQDIHSLTVKVMENMNQITGRKAAAT